MFKIFRRIRQKFINEKEFGSYVKYAFGEIVLVVIGILIAIQINSWNTVYKNRSEEKFYLNKLALNLKQDSTLLKEKMDNIDLSLKLIDTFLVEIQNKDLAQFSNPDFKAVLLGTFGFNSETSTFDNLISTGKLGLIKNQKTVDSIFVYYNQLENKTKRLNEAIEYYSRNTIGPYLMNFDHIVLDDSSNPENHFDLPIKRPYDYAQDLFIINAIGVKQNLSKSLKESYASHLRRADNLIRMLESEE